MTDNPAKVLIVEDEETFQYLIQESLDGFVNLTVSSGEEAISIGPDFIPDLIIMDIQLPGIDGFETCKILKQNSELSKTAVLFLSQISDIDNQLKAFSCGADDYVNKPFNQNILEHKVKKLIENKVNTENLLKSLEAGNKFATTLMSTSAKNQIVQLKVL